MQRPLEAEMRKAFLTKGGDGGWVGIEEKGGYSRDGGAGGAEVG